MILRRSFSCDLNNLVVSRAIKFKWEYGTIDENRSIAVSYESPAILWVSVSKYAAKDSNFANCSGIKKCDGRLESQLTLCTVLLLPSIKAGFQFSSTETAEKLDNVTPTANGC